MLRPIISLLLVIGGLAFEPSPARAAEPGSPAAPAAPAFAAAPVVPEGLGVNIHFTDPRPGEMEMIAAAGMRIVRMDFGWGAIERKAGEYDFSAYDRLVKACEAHRIKLLFILDYSNRLYDGGVSPHTDEGRAAFAKWAAASVRHFRGRGILWEMYNEPNIQFWKPKPNVDDYAKLALAVGKAIREAEPGETYIGPATSLIDLKFIEKCFEAGLLEYWSAVSVHPYRQKDPETVLDEYRKLRELIDKYAPKGKVIPILSGEWGYSTGWRNFDDDRQAKYLPRQWLTNLSAGVPVSIWYDWHDDGQNPREPEHHFGTVRFEYHERSGNQRLPRDGRDPVFDPKPSYRAAKALTGALSGYRFDRRLTVGDDKTDFVLLFAKGAGPKGASDVKLSVWTTSKEPRRLLIPADAGIFNATDYLGKPLPDLTADDKGLTVTASDTPQYLTPQNPNAALRGTAPAR